MSQMKINSPEEDYCTKIPQLQLAPLFPPPTKTLVIDDRDQNKLWAEFNFLQEQCQTWRDHSSLDKLIECIGKLRAKIEIPAPANVYSNYQVFPE